MTITNERGTAQPYACVDKRSMPAQTDYRVVRPGESLSVRRYVDCYDLAPGRYTIDTEYHDGNPDPPRPPAGTKVFTATVKAASVTVRIEGSPVPRSQE